MANALGRRAVRGLIIGGVAALLLAVIGAMNTDEAAFPLRLAYWLSVVLPGSVLGLLFSRLVEDWHWLHGRRWLEVLVVAVLVALPHTFIVVVASALMFGITILNGMVVLYFGAIVLLFSLVLTTINFISAPAGPPLALFHAPEPPPLPPADLMVDTIPAALAERLPPRIANGRLRALQAEDHYLRVHTDLGDDLVLMRMADAVALLDRLPGARVHRSWWVARTAVTGSSSRDGRTQLLLHGGLAVPVSRTARPILAADGWFL